MESAFKGRLKTGVIVNNAIKDPVQFLEAAAALCRHRIEETRKRNSKRTPIKINMVLCGDYVKPDNPEVQSRKYFGTRNFVILQSSDVGEILGKMKDDVLTQVREGRKEGVV